MEVNRDISYEEVLPTDKFAIQDMFLMRIHRLGLVYQTIMKPYYISHGMDLRAVAEFYAMADEFYVFAQCNIAKHLSKKDLTELEGYFVEQPQMTPNKCKRIYILFMTFANKSKLTELSEKRLLGSFAYARNELGIKTRRKE